MKKLEEYYKSKDGNGFNCYFKIIKTENTEVTYDVIARYPQLPSRKKYRIHRVCNEIDIIYNRDGKNPLIKITKEDWIKIYNKIKPERV